MGFYVQGKSLSISSKMPDCLKPACTHRLHSFKDCSASGKLKKERQLLTEQHDLGNKANPHTVYGHGIKFVFV